MRERVLSFKQLIPCKNGTTPSLLSPKLTVATQKYRMSLLYCKNTHFQMLPPLFANYNSVFRVTLRWVYFCSKRRTRNSALILFVVTLRPFFRLLLQYRTVNSVVARHLHPLSARLHSTAHFLVFFVTVKTKPSVRLEVHIIFIVVATQCFILSLSFFVFSKELLWFKNKF